MCQKLVMAIQVVVLILGGVFPWSMAAAQSAPSASLEEQLKAQYKLAKMGSDSNGPTVLEPGTLLVIQKGGILGVPQKNLAVCPSKYQDGNLHSPNALCTAMVKQVSSYFQAGGKVYPSKIDVNLKNEKISFGIVACDSCNGTTRRPPSSLR